jgi:hypothetical protein
LREQASPGIAKEKEDDRVGTGDDNGGGDGNTGSDAGEVRLLSTEKVCERARGELGRKKGEGKARTADTDSTSNAESVLELVEEGSARHCEGVEGQYA